MQITFIYKVRRKTKTSMKNEGGNSMKVADMIALSLVIIGGLNWLLVGLFEFDLVASVFGGQDEILSKIVYILVGLAALYSLKFFKHINDHYEKPHAVGVGAEREPDYDRSATAGATKTTGDSADKNISGQTKDPNINADVSGADRAGDPNNPDNPDHPEEQKNDETRK